MENRDASKVFSFISKEEREYERLLLWANGESRPCGRNMRMGFEFPEKLEENSIVLFCILPDEAIVDHRIKHVEMDGCCQCTASFLKPGWSIRVSNLGKDMPTHIISFDGNKVSCVEEKKFDEGDLKRRTYEFFKGRRKAVVPFSAVKDEQGKFARAEMRSGNR